MCKLLGSLYEEVCQQPLLTARQIANCFVSKSTPTPTLLAFLFTGLPAYKTETVTLKTEANLKYKVMYYCAKCTFKLRVALFSPEHVMIIFNVYSFLKICYLRP